MPYLGCNKEATIEDQDEGNVTCVNDVVAMAAMEGGSQASIVVDRYSLLRAEEQEDGDG